MPVHKEKITSGPSKGKYKVIDVSGKVHARATSKAKAERQVNLLNRKG